jgi:hypothetical protein
MTLEIYRGWKIVEGYWSGFYTAFHLKDGAQRVSYSLEELKEQIDEAEDSPA